jgi:hypothetical protein
MEVVHAVLEPCAADGDLEILQAKLEQLFVGEVGPGKFPTRHGALKPKANPALRWCHRTVVGDYCQGAEGSSIRPISAQRLSAFAYDEVSACHIGRPEGKFATGRLREPEPVDSIAHR